MIKGITRKEYKNTLIIKKIVAHRGKCSIAMLFESNVKVTCCHSAFVLVKMTNKCVKVPWSAPS